VALTGYRNVAHVRPGVRPIRFRTLFVNKSYRRYAVCHTTSVVAYVRQTIVNSHPGFQSCDIVLICLQILHVSVESSRIAFEIF